MESIHDICAKAWKAIMQLDLLKEFIKTAVIAAAGWFLKVVFDWWKRRKARKFWRPFLRDDLLIVLGYFGDEQSTQFEASHLMGVGDSMAQAELREYLEILGLKHCKVCFAEELDKRGDELKRPLISLGASGTNRVTMTLLERVNATWRFEDLDGEDPRIVDSTVHDKKYMPCYMRNGKTGVNAGIDYGLIVRASNPYDADMPALVIGGCFGYGTWGGVRHLLSKEFLKSKNAKQKSGYELLLEVQYERDAPCTVAEKATRTLQPPLDA
jgi:hypothetical protein